MNLSVLTTVCVCASVSAAMAFITVNNNARGLYYYILAMRFVTFGLMMQEVCKDTSNHTIERVIMAVVISLFFSAFCTTAAMLLGTAIGDEIQSAIRKRSRN